MAEALNDSTGWVVMWTLSGERHVVPVGDLREHLPAGCWCDPRRNDEDPMVVVHHSADERESYEQGRPLN